MTAFIVIGIIFLIVLFGSRHMGSGFSRDSIMNLYSSLLSDMNVDYRNMKISPENITSIKTSLNNFTSIIEKTAKYNNLTEDDKKWLITIIEEFRSALILWIRRHESELISYEKEIEHIAENTGYGSIRLAEKRLESQIQNLMRVQ